MTRIGIIVNENKLLESKAAFFADYFNFFADKVGKLYETELENPLSLIEKIIFQLTNSHNRKAGYIANYFSHDYFRNSEFLMAFEHYAPLEQEIEVFNNIIGNTDREIREKRVKWLNGSKELLPKLQTIKKELEESMVKKAFDALMTYLLCTHDLNTHKKEIIDVTKILVTEAFFVGKTKSDILKVFSRLLSTDPKIFPFASNIHSEVEKKQYLENRDFKRQFEGILNFFNEVPGKQILVLKIVGASMDNTSSFTYDQVQFFGSKNSKFSALKQRFKKLDKYGAAEFFNGTNFLFALIPIDSTEDDPILEPAFKIVQHAVDFLSLVLNKSLLLNREGYLMTTDFHGFSWRAKRRHEIEKRQLELLNDTPYIFLKNYKGPASDHILKHESVFILALKDSDIETFWKYIEYLFGYKNNINEVIVIVGKLLLLNEKMIRKLNVIRYLQNGIIPWQFDYVKFGLSAEELTLLRKELVKKKTKAFFKKIEYPFFTELNRIQALRHTKKRYEEIRKYYSRILLELYESRNSITHANTLHKKANIKLDLSVPDLISRLRWTLFSYIRKYPHLQFEKVIEVALKDSEGLLV